MTDGQMLVTAGGPRLEANVKRQSIQVQNSMGNTWKRRMMGGLEEQ